MKAGDSVKTIWCFRRLEVKHSIQLQNERKPETGTLCHSRGDNCQRLCARHSRDKR